MASMMTEPSRPLLAAIWRMGSSRAFRTMRTPVFSSPSFSPASFSTAGMALMRATPPPATMPSSTAALAAERASSMRIFFSFISTSVAAPTLITATPPASLARRSWSFSRSKSEVVFSIWARIWAMRSWMAFLSPSPLTMMVFSFWTVTRLARPSWDMLASFSSRPRSEVMTWPPVRVAISWSISLRRSPKPGALTATQVKVPRILFTSRVARASPSTSSAMMMSLRPDWTTCSSRGRIS